MNERALARKSKRKLSANSTPVHTAAGIIGDPWSVLILRDAVLRKQRRFVEFRQSLGLNRATLTKRLSTLTGAGLLEHKLEPPNKNRFYVPTQIALDYLPVLLSMKEWGERWLLKPNEKSLLDVYHTSCESKLRTELICTTCNGIVGARNVYAERPNANVKRPPSQSNTRASGNEPLEKEGICPIARCLSVIGDRWSVLIIQEAFFGLRHFDMLQRRLGIAPNILSNRLLRLTNLDVLTLTQNPNTGRRDYRLTARGLDFYRVPLSMRQWAIQSLGVADPLHFYHTNCGQDLEVTLQCVSCLDPVRLQDVAARPNINC